MKSPCLTLFANKKRPAGLSVLMLPAGEMWSVVVESPRIASARAPVTAVIGDTSFVMVWKNGGSWM